MNAPSLRVLHVLEATLGGTRRYLEDVAISTAGLPFTQALVYGTSRADSGFDDLLALARRAGWQLTAVESLRRAVRPIADARSAVTIRRAVLAFKPSIVHVHSAKAGALGRIAALACRPVSPAVVYSPHALPSRLGAVYMLAERALAPLTSRFIAVSDSERQEIVAERMAPRARVDVVYPRIDAEAFAPRDRQTARRDLGLPDVPIVIGIGRLAPQKNPVSFVQTLARVRLAHPSTLGIWVGDGELRSDVEAAAMRCGLDTAFRIAGWMSDVRPYIAAADILLSTSRYESFGYVIPETLAMERPVVASRVMGTIDVFWAAAQNMMFMPDDLDAAAGLIGKLIEDKRLYDELAHAGRLQVIERFSVEAMRTALVAAYSAAVS